MDFYKKYLNKDWLFDKLKNNFDYKGLISDFFNWFSYILTFLFSIIVLSTIIGTLFSFFGLAWGKKAFLLITIISGIFALRYYKIFKIENLLTLLSLIGVLVFTILIYGQISPVLEMGQDQNCYMLKSFNLVNHGFLYKPMDSLSFLIKEGVLNTDNYSWFAAIQNGTKLDALGRLNVEFFPGSCYVFAFCGVINKAFTFYGATLIAVGIASLLFFISNYLFNKKNPIFSAVLSITFLISPAITWFCRASYTEPYALFLFLFITYIIIFYNKEDIGTVLLMCSFISLFYTRIDMLSALFLGIFVFMNKKIIHSVVYTIFAFIAILLSSVYKVYYEGIISNNTIFYYSHYLLLLFFIILFVTFALFKKFNKKIDFIFESKIFTVFLFIFCGAILLLIFRDNFFPPEIGYVDRVQMRTFNEVIFERLFLLLPAHMLLLGLMFIPFFIRDKGIDISAKLFFLFMFFTYSALFVNSYNAPQIYFNLRRYIFVIMPALYIGFVFFVSKISPNYIKNLLVVITFFITLNLYFNANQIVEFKGMDKSVKIFTDKYKENNNYTIIYNTNNLRKDISALLSYGRYDFVPIYNNNLIPVIYEKLSDKNILFIDNKRYPNQKYEEYSIEYQRMGENYYGFPGKQNFKYDFYIYNLSSEGFNSSNGYIIYPNQLSDNLSGIHYGSSWSTGDTIITLAKPYNTKGNESNLVIERYGANYPFANDINKSALKVFVNDNIELKYLSSKDNLLYYFQIPNTIAEINKVQVKSNTFVPAEFGQPGGDTRVLGIDLKYILIKETPYYRLNKKITFGINGNSDLFKVSGWSENEPGFTWSEGDRAELSFLLSEMPKKNLILKIHMLPFVVKDKLKFQDVDLFVNDTFLKNVKISNEDDYIFDIPMNLIKYDRFLNLTLKIRDVKQATEYGVSDARSLGVAFKNLEIKYNLKDIYVELLPNDNVITFGVGGNSDEYKIAGLSKNEDGFNWMEEESSKLAFSLNRLPSSDLKLKMTLFPFTVSGKIDYQNVDVIVNGSHLKTFKIDKEGDYLVDIKRSMIKDDGNIILELRVKNPKPALEYGVSDARKLSVALRKVEVIF